MKTRTLVLAGSVLLFLASLTQDAYYLAGDNPEAWSAAWGLLLVGWMGVYVGIFAWLANPLLFLAWGLCLAGRFRAALIASLAAVLFALSFLLHSTIIVSEAPTYKAVTGYGAGYWLWVASMMIMAVGTWLLYHASRSGRDRSHGAGAGPNRTGQ